MKFIDEAKIEVIAGNGGNGVDLAGSADFLILYDADGVLTRLYQGGQGQFLFVAPYAIACGLTVHE